MRRRGPAPLLRAVFATALACAVAARPACAQAAGARAGVASGGAACSYRTCALLIVPTWNGLAVVRGDAGERVANLHFFWPRDVAAALAGPDASVPGAAEARRHARHAVGLRRVGAALTDAGVLLGVAVAAGALDGGRLRRRDALLAGAGGAALVASVPLQFAADGALSRAVWWHNQRYVP